MEHLLNGNLNIKGDVFCFEKMVKFFYKQILVKENQSFLGTFLKAVFSKIVVFEHDFNFIVEWSGRHSTPAGSEERLRPRRRS
ncbi:hypothetical protein CJ195_03085 [Bacillus sp. UMB0899]|nr:hypothetical protein CJ195_03085 [Bacillus sp. UMB0899]